MAEPVMATSGADRADLVGFIKGQIGWRSRETEHVIEAGHVRRFCEATEDDVARWSEVVPPTFVVAVGWGEPHHELPGLPEYGTRWLNGGDRFEYLRPVRVGDRLTSRSTLVSADEKIGRSGPLMIAVFECLYVNERSENVVRHLATRIRL